MNGNSAAGAIDRQPDLLARLQHVIRALKDQWTLCSKPANADYAYQNGQSYITGPFADFIEH